MPKPLSIIASFFVVLLLAQSVLAQTQPSRVLRFMHIGDPQFGYELDTKGDNLLRMQKITDAMQTENPDFVIIPGDFVENRLIEEWWAYEKSVENIESPMVLVPGNHDVVNMRDLQRYRKKMGKDYGAYQFDWLTVLALNSEVMRNDRINNTEFETQWQWFESAISTYQQSARNDKALIIVTHRPPFSRKVNEQENEVNWPPKTRLRLLNLAKMAGVKAIVVGHTHTTREIFVPDYGLTIYTVGGTARVFDDQGSGYRLFKMTSDRLEQDYTQTGVPPKTSKGFLGFNQWTPRLLNFSIRHWFWTSAFFVVAAWMFFNSRRWSISQLKPRKNDVSLGSRSLSRALFLCGSWYVFFAVNMQMDFDELFTELGRRFLPESIQDIRHQISPFIVGVAGFCLFCISFWQCRGKRWLRAYGLLLLAIPSLAWFCLQVMSNSIVIPNNIVWPESVWDKIFLVSLIVSLLLVGLKRNAVTKSTV